MDQEVNSTLKQIEDFYVVSRRAHKGHLISNLFKTSLFHLNVNHFLFVKRRLHNRYNYTAS